MAVLDKKTLLSKLLVKDAMRRHVVQLSEESSIEKCIRYMIKFKVNAVLVSEKAYQGWGVISKTDLISLYYADIPLNIPLREVKNAPLLYCCSEDRLEDKLSYMQDNQVRRLYVLDRDSRLLGVLGYSDIVGVLYRMCRKCTNNIFMQKPDRDFDYTEYLKVRDAMSRYVKYCLEKESIQKLIESLSEHRFGAMLVKDNSGQPVGVASKTDLVWAYKHQVSSENNIQTIMSKNLFSCPEDEFLANSIHNMIINDVQRFFVHKNSKDNIVGVLSLTDAARARSGTCKACSASRIN